MEHLGDITKINGANVTPVDIVVGGSPCQDLSVAGKREGLAGARSGLFMEQIRIIKEMREHDRISADDNIRHIRPRFMVWENVPGAFSSNNGEDFRAVLEETARIADKDAIIPRPPKGKWTPSGCIMGDGWSIAWRVHDAQFWGVPQRRKRIALVADFAGGGAPQILFERESLSGDPSEGGEARKGTSSDSEGNAGETISWQERAGCEGGAREYSSNTNGSEPCQQSIINQSCNWDGTQTAPTLTANNAGGGQRMPDKQNFNAVICLEGNGQRDSHNGDGFKESEKMYTLNTVEHHGVCYGLDRASFNQGQNALYNFSVEEELAQTIVAKGAGGVLTKK